ncbi:hypothetical protein AADEFJLK_04682 [Methylovulum psychrotolerans]|uniref:Uncharacterized protein n=1 Tax=Methylovulum psychrotolerans TaxID=1704499 RepID=A0A2S5CFP5_9GAMM|nr:hypothetical protein AADEFJLK_04682 [Methylovulum psychrotolerans]
MIIVFKSEIGSVLISEKYGDYIRYITQSIFTIIIGVMLWSKNEPKMEEHSGFVDSYDVILMVIFLACNLFLLIKCFYNSPQKYTAAITRFDGLLALLSNSSVLLASIERAGIS